MCLSLSMTTFEAVGMTFTFADWKSGVPFPKGWDAADAVDDGWTGAQLDHFMRATVRPWIPPGERAAQMPQERDPAPAGHSAAASSAKPVREARTTQQVRSEPATITQIHTRKTFAADQNWMSELVTNEEGKTKPGIAKNWSLFLEHHPDTARMLAYDELAANVFIMRRPPWFRGAERWKPRQIIDTDYSEVVEWLETLHMTPKFSNIGPVINKVAARNAFHPVREYLGNLPEWDGVARLDAWLIKYAGAADNALHRAFARKMLCAAVRRVKQPGCKFDHVLVLQGRQDLGKSSLIRALCHDPVWFTDQAKVGADAKETIERTAGSWIVELAELDGLSKREANSVKSFVTTVNDKARAAYARTVTEKPRQFVLIGTTNESAFLADLTGNRRWWPVLVTCCDVTGLTAVRDQLWAEAVQSEPDEKLWLDSDALKAAAAVATDAVIDHGPWLETLADRVPDGPIKVSVVDAWQMVGIDAGSINKISPALRASLKKAMMGLGFEPETKNLRRHGKQTFAYVRGDLEGVDWWSPYPQHTER
jgi:hypothetical protein